MNLRELARALDGEVCGAQVKAPAPGHSAKDRSLSVALADNEDGFIVHGFGRGADDPKYKDYVRQKLGVGPFKPNGGKGKNGGETKSKSREIIYETGAVRHRKTRVEYSFFSIKGRTPLL
jgi:putative DNA primase/helicase